MEHASWLSNNEPIWSPAWNPGFTEIKHKTCMNTEWAKIFDGTHTKYKFIPLITSSMSVALQGLTLDSTHYSDQHQDTNKAMYRICMCTSTNNWACFASQKHTEIHILGISICVLYETCSRYRFITWNDEKKKTPKPKQTSNCTLDQELKWLGKNSNFYSSMHNG